VFESGDALIQDGSLLDYTHNAHPYLVGERVEEAEHSRLEFFRFLDHDTDTETHEGLGEVDDTFTH